MSRHLVKILFPVFTSGLIDTIGSSMYPPLLSCVFPIDKRDLANTTSKTIKERCAVLLNEDLLVKNSLPLQCAITCASQDELIIFITPKSFSKLPTTVHGLPNITSNAMKNIKFLYYENVEDIRTFLSSIKQPFPCLIVLDRLDFYLQQLPDHDWDCSVAKLIALLIDTLHFISEQRDQTCCLLATCIDKDFIAKVNIWKLFFTQLWSIDYIKDEKKFNLNITQLQDFEFDYKVTFYLKLNELCMDKLFQISK